MYAREVAPLLAAAGVKTTVLSTQHAGHAVDMATHLDLKTLDVIACVGMVGHTAPNKPTYHARNTRSTPENPTPA